MSARKLLGLFFESGTGINGSGHAFAALFDVDECGHMTRYFPIDFSGVVFEQDFDNAAPHAVDAGFVMPIDAQKAAELEQKMRELDALVTAGKSPYYYLPLQRIARDKHRQAIATFSDTGRMPTQCLSFARDICSTYAIDPARLLGAEAEAMTPNELLRELCDVMRHNAADCCAQGGCQTLQLGEGQRSIFAFATQGEAVEIPEALEQMRWRDKPLGMAAAEFARTPHGACKMAQYEGSVAAAATRQPTARSMTDWL